MLPQGIYVIDDVLDIDTQTTKRDDSHRVGRMVVTPYDLEEGMVGLFFYADEQGKGIKTSRIQTIEEDGISTFNVETRNSIYVLRHKA